MRYQDFSEQDRAIIDEFVERYNEFDYLSVDELQDDEVFFRTKDEVLSVMKPWLDSPGPYGTMARELFEYFDGTELEYGDMELCWLEKGNWGYVCRVGDGRYLFWSDSWSDSGLFFQ